MQEGGGLKRLSYRGLNSSVLHSEDLCLITTPTSYLDRPFHLSSYGTGTKLGQSAWRGEKKKKQKRRAFGA